LLGLQVLWENIARKRLLDFGFQKKGLLEKMLPPHVKLTHVGVIFYVMKGYIHVLKEANGPPLVTIYF